MKKKRIKAWLADTFAEVADEAVERAVDSPVGSLHRYRNTYSTLTIHFAAGSEPQAVSIPYQPFGNKTDIHIPYRLVKDSDA